MGIIYSHRSLGCLLSLLLMICNACQNHAEAFHAASRYDVDLSAVPDHLLHEKHLEPRYQPIHDLIRAYASYYQDHGEWPPPLRTALRPADVILNEDGRLEIHTLKDYKNQLELTLKGDRIITAHGDLYEIRYLGHPYHIPQQGYTQGPEQFEYWEKRKIHVVFVGDSHTAKKVFPQRCLEVLQQSSWFKEVSHQIIAKGGATPARMKEMLKDLKLPTLGPEDLKIAVVLAGTNAYNIDDHRALVQTLNQDFDLPVVIMRTPPRLNPGDKKYGFPHANARFNSQLRDYHHNKRLPVVIPPGAGISPAPPDNSPPGDLTLLMNIPEALRDPSKKNREGDWLNPEYAADHTHLNQTGYELLGLELANFILARMPRRDLVQTKFGYETWGPLESQSLFKNNGQEFPFNHWTQIPKPLNP